MSSGTWYLVLYMTRSLNKSYLVQISIAEKFVLVFKIAYIAVFMAYTMPRNRGQLVVAIYFSAALFVKKNYDIIIERQ